MPGGLTLLAGTNASVPTPSTGKVTIFFSTDLNLPAYKDDAGIVHSLVGATGAAGQIGLIGPTGDIGEEGDFVVAMPGPQGNPGNTGATGAQGPVGPMFIGNDGEDGDPGLPGAAGVSGSTNGFFIATLNVTDAQVRTLNSVPKLIVAAPGANKTLIPLRWYMVANVTTGFASGLTLNVRWVGTTTVPLTAFTVSINTLSKRLALSAGNGQLNNNSTSIPTENIGLEVFAGQDIAAGGATTGGFQFYVEYTIATTP